MQSLDLEALAASPVDDATKAAIEEAQAQGERGETVTLEQAQINIRKQYQAWKRAEKKTNAA